MASILFPTIRIFREFNDLDHRLYEIFMTLVERYWPDATKSARVVCIWRSEAENTVDGAHTAIHCQPAPYRAADVGAREFTAEQVAATSSAVNKLWIYDPARPDLLVCFSQPHGTGPHFHLQVHPSTRKR